MLDWRAGDYSTADEKLRSAAYLFEENEDWSMAATVYLWRISANYRLNRFDSLKQILTLAQRLHDEQDLVDETDTQERVHYYWAMYYEATGQYREAFAALQQASDLLRQGDETTAEDSSLLTSHLAMSGSIHYDRRDFDQAIQDYHASLAFFPGSRPDPPKRLNIVNNLGLAYIEKGEAELGISYLTSNLDILDGLDEEIHAEDYIQTYLNLAKGHLDKQQLQQAVYYLQQAAPYMAKYPADKHNWLWLRGSMLEQQGQYHWSAALEAYQSALQLREEALGPSHPTIAKVYLSTGELLLKMGRPQQALQQFQNGLSVLDREFDSQDKFANPALGRTFISYELFALLRAKGALLTQLYPTEAAAILPTYRLAINAVDSLRMWYESDASKLLLSREVKELFVGAIALIDQLHQQRPARQLLEEAFTYMEKSKALLLLENLRKWRDIRIHRGRTAGSSPAFIQLLDEERQLKRDLVLLRRALHDFQDDADNARRPVLEQALQQTSARLDQIKQRLSREAPDYYRAAYDLDVASLHQIQQGLLHDERTALVTYCLSDSVGFSMCIESDKAVLLPLNSPQQWQQAFTNYRQALEDRPSHALAPLAYQRYVRSATSLYDQLLRAQLQQLSPEIDRLYLVPDNILGLLAFEALLVSSPTYAEPSFHPDHLDYLIETYSLAYAYSATLLFESMLRSREAGALRAPERYGGFAPVFLEQQAGRSVSKDCFTESLRTLPYSRECIEQSRDLYDGQMYLHDQATVTHFREYAGLYQVLQLSTHACVDEEDALFNVLYFHDTTLATFDIFDIPLTAELVILSACETGRGDLLQGEGIMSLSRAFYYAGCPNIVTSLWPADDYATKELMVAFNAYLQAGWEKDEALRRAKLDYLTDSKRMDSERAPAFWATFVLIGHQEALTSPVGVPGWSWGLLVGLVAALGLYFYRYART